MIINRKESGQSAEASLDVPNQFSPNGKIILQEIITFYQSTGYQYMMELSDKLRNEGVEIAVVMKFHGKLQPKDRRLLRKNLPFYNIAFNPLAATPTTNLSLMYNLGIPVVVGEEIIFETADIISMQGVPNGAIVIAHGAYRGGRTEFSNVEAYTFPEWEIDQNIIPTAIDNAFRSNPPIRDPLPF